MTATTAYTWDEVSCEIGEHPVILPADTPTEAVLALIDSQVAELTTCDPIHVTRSHRHPNGTLVAEGTFNGGRHDTALFYHPTDSSLARAAAEEFRRRQNLTDVIEEYLAGRSRPTYADFLDWANAEDLADEVVGLTEDDYRRLVADAN